MFTSVTHLGISNKLTCLLALLLFSLAPYYAAADCSTPAVIVSATNGNFTNPATWVGGTVPTSCDFVIINHSITLNNSFIIGQNGTGGLTINTGGSLTGSGWPAISIQGGGNYTLTNNGTLSVGTINMWSGNPGARFSNNGTATISNPLMMDGNTVVINSGVLTLAGNLQMNGATIENHTGATINLHGTTTLNTSGGYGCVIDNSGTINTYNSNSNQAFYITMGRLYNRSSGFFYMHNNGGFYLGPTTTSYVNIVEIEGVMEVNNLAAYENAELKNFGNIVVNNNFINASKFSNFLGGSITIAGNFTQQPSASSFTRVDGFMKVTGNFRNERLINGSGGIEINGYSENWYNGSIQGDIDICDNSAPAGQVLDFYQNPSTVATTVTKCQYVLPCASAKPGIITGPANPCAGQTGLTYSINPVAGALSYSWIFPAGWVITAGQGTTTVTVTAGSATGYATVQATTTCGEGRRDISLLPSGQAPAQPGTIMGPPANLCANQTGFSFTITPVNGATSYNWEVPSGWTILTGQGTTSISVTTGTAGGQIKVAAANLCGTSAQQTLTVTANNGPGAIGPITGSSSSPQNPCIQYWNGYEYSIPQVPGATYLWSVPNGWTISWGQGTHRIGVNNVTTTPGNVTVTVSNSCGSATATIAVSPSNGLPATPSILGPAAPCAGVASTFTATSANAVNYSWSVNNGWSMPANTYTAVMPLTPAFNSNNTTIMVVASNSCGTASASVTRQAALPPAQPASFTKAPAPGICEGSTGTFQISNVSNASSFSWSFPATWSHQLNPNQRIADFTAGQVSGNVQVFSIGSNGCVSTPLTANVSVVAIPAQPLSITGPESFIPGNNYTFSVEPVAGATSYIWSAPAGWAYAANQNSTEFSATSGLESGNISVIAVNSCGQSTQRFLAIAEASEGNPLPVVLSSFTARPEKEATILNWVTASEENSAYFSVERSVNGTRFFTIGTVTAAGNSSQVNQYLFKDQQPVKGISYYRLKQVDTDGKFEYSKAVAVAVKSATEIAVAPNPFGDMLTLSLRAENLETLQVTLTDIRGIAVRTLVADTQTGNGQVKIETAGLPAGAYILQVTGPQTRFTKQLIKF